MDPISGSGLMNGLSAFLKQKSEILWIRGIAGSGKSQLAAHLLASQTNVCGVLCREVPGTVNGVYVDALPDSGSTVDAVSESFAKQHGLEIVAKDIPAIRLPGGNVAKCIGIVVGDFRFQNETQVHRREFHVLKHSIYDLILGRGFLQSTETLTKYKHRIVEKIRSGIQKFGRLFLLLDTPRELLPCTVNMVKAMALPDTGSDIMVVSGDFARRNNFNVLRGETHRRLVELINGSTIRTSGTVLDAELQFGVPGTALHRDHGHNFETLDFPSSLPGNRQAKSTAQLTFFHDLHVIEDLPCDIILSSEFVFRNEVFSGFKGLFCSDSTGSPQSTVPSEHSLLVIREKKTWRWPWIQRKSQSQTHTATQLDTLETMWDQSLEVEMTRRNAAQLRIASLQEPQRSIEQRQEAELRALWDREHPNPRLNRLPLSSVADSGGQLEPESIPPLLVASVRDTVDAASPDSSIATAASLGPVPATGMGDHTVAYDPG